MRTKILALGLLFLVSPSARAQWTVAVGGNPGRDGQASVVGPTAPTISWQGSLSGIVAQQGVVDNGLLVVNRISSFTIPTGTWIVAHEVATGAIRWQIQLPMNFPDAWRSRVTGFRDGRVYASRSGNTNAEYLYALSPVDGSILWQSQDLITETSTESISYAPNGDPITTGKVGGQTMLLRIDATNGQTVWSAPRSCPTSGGCDAAVFSDRVYVFEAGGGGGGPPLTAFDVATGARLYSSPGITQGFVQQVGPFVGPDGTVYAPRTQNNAATDFLVAFTDTGAALVEKWSVPIGYIPFASHAVGPDGSVYTYDPSLALIRLDPVDGSVLDTTGPLLHDFPAQPRLAVDPSGKLYFTNGGFGNGRLTCFTPDLLELWSVPVTNVNVGGPVIAADGTLVVCGVGTDVRAYRTTCAGYVVEYGDGCAGTGACVPSLSVTGCPTPGASIQLEVGNALGSATAALIVGTGQGSAPLNPACDLQVLPVASITFLSLNGAGPCNGQLTLPGTIPVATPVPTDLNAQLLVRDAGAAGGTIAASQPVRIHIE